MTLQAYVHTEEEVGRHSIRPGLASSRVCYALIAFGGGAFVQAPIGVSVIGKSTEGAAAVAFNRAADGMREGDPRGATWNQGRIRQRGLDAALAQLKATPRMVR